MPASQSFTSCGAPVKITISQLEALTTAGSIPDKRSMTPPCTVTYNGQTYPTYVEMDGITIKYSPYTGDCDAVITGYCDVHLEFACNISAGCLFEIDQTWFAAGYAYPVNTQGNGSITPGTIVNATGFLYIDEHGIHELHPTVSVAVPAAPPPPGGSSTGSGGGTVGSGGGCFYCGFVPEMTTISWLVVLGGVGLVFLTPLVITTVRARSRLARVKRHLGQSALLD